MTWDKPRKWPWNPICLYVLIISQLCCDIVPSPEDCVLLSTHRETLGDWRNMSVSWQLLSISLLLLLLPYYCRAATSQQPCSRTIQAGFPDKAAGFLPETRDKGLCSGTNKAQVGWVLVFTGCSTCSWKVLQYCFWCSWPPCVADADIIFLPCGFFFLLSLFFLA